MSVPPKSHQQSVSTTISGIMRSIYTVSPEAVGLLQLHVVPIIIIQHSRWRGTAQNNRRKLGPTLNRGKQ